MQADQDARERRAEEDRRAGSRPGRTRSRTRRRLLLADELRHDRALHGEVRREEDAGRRDEREQRGEGEQRRARGAAGSPRGAARARGRTTSIVRRVPTRAAIAPPQKPSTRDREDLGDDHPRHPLRRAGGAQHEPRQREPRHLRAESTRSPPRRAARRARRSRSRLHGSAAAPKLTTTRARAAPRVAAAELVEQRLEALAELLELASASARASPTTSASRAASAAGSSCSRRSASRTRCCWRADELVAEHRRLEPVGRELDARRGRAPRPLAARAAVALLDEAPLRERAQVVAARRGAVADELARTRSRSPARPSAGGRAARAASGARARASRAGRSRVSEFSKEIFRN